MAATRLTGVVHLWACLLLAAGCTGDAAPATQQVAIGGRTFTLELALDDTTRYRGLSGRADIPADGGMLFVFPYARPLQFVMRDCPAPIDLVFLGPNGRVVATHAMQPEPGVPEDDLVRYASGWDAQFAIELPGGTLPLLDLRPGQRVDLPAERLKSLAR